MNYDGTGMTAGIHQAVAVYPKSLEQGPLWKLLARIGASAQTTSDNELVVNYILLAEFLLDYQVYVSPDGVARNSSGNQQGNAVSGKRLRFILSGSEDGKMPVRGKNRERAEGAVALFRKLFGWSDTFGIQEQWGIEKFIKQAERTKLRFCSNLGLRRKTLNTVLYSPRNIHSSHFDPLQLDLAYCMFWSHSVNAPTQALKCLCRVVDTHGPPPSITDTLFYSKQQWAQHLIKELGNEKYGRWDDDIKNGRYQRTRKAAMQLWHKDFFVGPAAVMPKDLEG